MTTLTRWLLVCSLLVCIAADVSAQGSSDPGARIISKRIEIVISGTTARWTERTRTQITSRRGNMHARIFAHESEHLKAERYQARILSANGKVLQKFDRDDMVKQCGYGASFTIYDDNCLWYRTVERADFPYLIEEESVSKYLSLFKLAGRIKLMNELPVDTIEIRLLSDQPVDWKLYDMKADNKSSISGTSAESVWLFTNLVPGKKNDQVPDEYGDRRSLWLAPHSSQFGTAIVRGRSWHDIASCYRQLASDRYGFDPSAAGKSPQQLYKQVRDELRYVSVVIGTSGWQPFSYESICRNGYGDCKDKTTVLVSRLRSAGYVAWPVLVNTRGNGVVIDSTFPSNSFNHVITLCIVGADSLWFDPTCESCGDWLPYEDSGIHGLVVTDVAGVLVRTPAARSSDTRTVRTMQATIDSSLFPSYKATIRLERENARLSREFLSSENRTIVEDFLTKEFVSDMKACKLDSFAIDAPPDKMSPVTITMYLTATRPLDQSSEAIYLPALPLAIDNPFGGISLEERTVPIQIGRPSESADTVIWAMPLLAADSVRLPTDTVIVGPNITLSLRYSRHIDGVMTIAERKRTHDIVYPEQFNQLRQYLRDYRTVVFRPIKVWKKAA